MELIIIKETKNIKLKDGQHGQVI